MSRLFFKLYAVFVTVIAVLSGPLSVSGQETSPEAQDSAGNTAAQQQSPEVVRPSVEQPHYAMDRAVKYAAGFDGKWFTKDDNAIECFVAMHDGMKMVKQEKFKPGLDGIAFTDDDVLTGVEKYEYEGNTLKGTVMLDPLGTVQGRTVFEYDGETMVRGVEYGPDGNEIRKVAVFEPDRRGRMDRMTEFRAEKGGQGPDGKWLTQDDLVSLAIRFVYRGNNDKVRDILYKGPGHDGKWFTKDDEMDSYVLYQYIK